MRVPLVYTATDIVRWNDAEEYEPGKWRPSRCCGFWSLRHLRQQLRVAWRVFIGRYDALNWGPMSGEAAARHRYKDCTDPEFFNAAKVVEYREGTLR